MPSRSPADLDAVTLDAMGTLVALVDPVGTLQAALRERDVEAEPEEVRAAFAAEVEYYVPRSHEGRDAESLRALGTSCAAVFLRHLGAELDPEEFAPAFVDSLRFQPLEGVPQALAAFRRAGLALACVSNWDVSLAGQLERAGLTHHLDAIVSSAEAGAPKPAADAFLLALDRLGVPAERALHVGDGDTDEEGAAAAGLRFEPAPLARVPERLGLETAA
jgi:HAD superfamily hydrolase (TIGR01509 family)